MKKTRLAIEVGVALLLLAVFVAQGSWPFSRPKITQTLEQHFQAKLEMKGFHPLFFPHPGCVLDGVVLRREGDAAGKPFIEAKTVRILGHYTDFLMRPKRLHLIEADGLRVDLNSKTPGGGLLPGKPSKPTVVETFRTVDANLVFRAFAMPVKTLEVRNFGGEAPATFSVVAVVPKLQGEVTAEGSLGPLVEGKKTDSPLHAQYHLRGGQLGFVHGLRGTVNAEGTIDGTVGHIEVHDAAESPDLMLVEAGHPMEVHSKFGAEVEGTTGDVTIQWAQLKFRHTELEAEGTVAGKGTKTAKIAFTSKKARVEDLLYFFVHQQPALTGAIALKATTVLPPEKRKFLERLRLEGECEMTGVKFTHEATADKVSKLSATANGDPKEKDPEPVEAKLSGQVRLRDANAELRNVIFEVPGGRAIGNGHYGLESKEIDLRGRLLMDTKLSHATTGIKSVLLTPFNGLFKSKHHASAVGVSVTGRYPHPVYKVSLDPDRYKSRTIAKLREKKKGEKVF